jgi:hypothetical protein
MATSFGPAGAADIIIMNHHLRAVEHAGTDARSAGTCG